MQHLLVNVPDVEFARIRTTESRQNQNNRGANNSRHPCNVSSLPRFRISIDSLLHETVRRKFEEMDTSLFVRSLIFAVLLEAYNPVHGGEEVGPSFLTKEMYQHILQQYDKRIRPGYEDSQPLTIDIELFVVSVYEIDEVKNEFTLELYLRQFWKDSRLAMSQFNISTHVFLNTGFIKEVWLPTTYFVKSKRAYEHKVDTDNVLLRVDTHGNIFYSRRLTVTTTCVLDLAKFPTDVQICNLTIESYAYQTTDCVYQWGKRDGVVSSGVESGDMKYLNLPAFTVEEIRTTSEVNNYSIGYHSSLVASFKFKRRIGCFMIETFIPSSIAIAVSWVAFWISPDSVPARIALGITTILTMVTISGSSRQSLPKVSYIKAVDWYLLACLLFVFGALIEYAFMQYNRTANKVLSDKLLTTRNMADEKVDGCFDKLKKKKLRSRDEEIGSEQITSPSTSNTVQRTHFLMSPDRIDEWSRIIFPATFVVFNIIFWSVMISIVD